MKYDLVPVKTRAPKLMWEIVAEFMHGDADHYSKEKVKFAEEDDFLEKVKILKDRLAYRQKFWNAAIDSNNAWADEQEGWLEVPFEYGSDSSWRADIDGFECFYYDENGVKFKVVFNEEG